MKYTVRAAVAVALLLGLYVVALGVVLLVVLLVLAFGLRSPLHLVVDSVLGAMVLVGLGQGLLAGMKPAPRPAGVLLTEEAQPRLWAEVHAVARYVGTRAPDEIRLFTRTNAGVLEDSRWLGLVAGRRVLYLGAPLLAGLSELQLRAVLAHELGHYAGRHTALLGITYRGQQSLGRVTQRLSRSIFVWVFVLYGKLYLAVAGAVNRRQELEADLVSARLTGRNVMSEALNEMQVLVVAWHVFLRDYAGIAAEHGLRPTGLYDGFQVFLQGHAQDPTLLAARARVRPRTAYETHPDHTERAAALARSGLPVVQDDTGPAYRLLENVSATLRPLEETVFADRALRAASWEEIGAVVGAARVRDTASRLAGSPVLHRTGGPGADAHTWPTVTLAAVVDVLSRGGGPELATGFVAPGTRLPERVETATRLVGDLVAHVLVEAGVARHRVDWSGPLTLVDDRDRPVDPWVVVRPVVAGSADVTTFTDWLAGHGVACASLPVAALPVEPPVDLPVATPVEVPVVDAPSAPAAALVADPPAAPVRAGGAHAAAAPLGALAPLAGDGVHALEVRDDALVLARSDGDLVIGWPELAAVTLGMVHGQGMRLTVQTVGGHRHVMRVLDGTRSAGDPWGALRERIGPRLHTGV